MNIVLLNEDNLNHSHPVFKTATENGDYKTIFIFDENILDELSYSFKRIVFIYECLKDIKCQIFKGQTFEILKHLNPEKIFIPKTSNHYLKSIYSNLEKSYKIEIIAEKKFKPVKNHKRFFQFYNEFKKDFFKK